MTSKYSRQQSSFSRQSDLQEDTDHWLHQFETKLAVQPARPESLFDQINSIMNGKAKFPTVDAAVEDMMQRSGYSAYLKQEKLAKEKANESKTATKKTAQAQDQMVRPKIIQDNPVILQTLRNIIDDNKGNLPISAIIDRLHNLHGADVSEEADWNDDKLIRLVSQLNLQAKQNNPANYENLSNLGKNDNSNTDVDPSNTDAFNALMPAKQ